MLTLTLTCLKECKGFGSGQYCLRRGVAVRLTLEWQGTLLRTSTEAVNTKKCYWTNNPKTRFAPQLCQLFQVI